MLKQSQWLLALLLGLAELWLAACGVAPSPMPPGVTNANAVVPTLPAPLQAATEPPLSPTASVIPTSLPSLTLAPAVQIELDPPQAEPGQPVTIRVTGLPPALVAGKAAACVALEDEAGESRTGPQALSSDWTGAMIARTTLGDRLSPGTYQWVVSVCSTGPETPADIEIGRQLASAAYTITARSGQFDRAQRILSPDGRWTAVLNETVGSLDLQGSEGEIIPVFPPGNTASQVAWSPDSRRLLVVRTNYLPGQPGQPVQSSGPVEIWQVRPEEAGNPVRLFQSTPQPISIKPDVFAPEQIMLGQWSPDNRHVLFWLGPLSASILADGMSLLRLDVQTGKAVPLGDAALLNPRYQSWAPDGSALAFTAGGYRSAQVNKWLNLFDLASSRVTTVVSDTEQIPGIVAWSPRGDLIAYAAVPASETDKDLADWMSFENTAIVGRRVYLLDPVTGKHWPLNDANAFQDAPTWSDDGAILYYVQREADSMVLMAADPTTGQAQVIPGTRQPAPRAVGYYGQSNWDDLLAHRPETPRVPVPPLAETYTNPTYGYTLSYPAGWTVGQGWQSITGWQAMPTLSSYPPDAPRPDLRPFSGQALIAIQVVEMPEGDLEVLLDKALKSAGPDQILDRGSTLIAFDQRDLTVDGRPAIRLETLGEFGTVNHVLVVLDEKRGLVLRGRGDGRVFDAVVGSLHDKPLDDPSLRLPARQPGTMLPLPRPAILDVFPLEADAIWVYSTTVDYEEGGQPIHWTGLITETVISLTVQGNDWLFGAELQGHPVRNTSEDRIRHYVALDDRLYQLAGAEDPLAIVAADGQGFEWSQVLTWPLEVEQQWGDLDMLARGDGWYVWRVEAQEPVATPAGTFKNCYRLGLWTNPDHTLVWFCPGTGFVRREYRHHGSRHDEVWELMESRPPTTIPSD
jgi:hypothetical protein